MNTKKDIFSADYLGEPLAEPWIPLSADTLPPFEEPVLVTGNDDKVHIARLEKAATTSWKGNTSFGTDWLDGDMGSDQAWYTVIAWQNLPEPYQKP